MELLEDLGTRVRPSGGTCRWGLYKCPSCTKEYELLVSTINYRKRLGKAEVCRSCANIIIAQESGYSKSEKIKVSYLDTFSKVHGSRYDYSKFIYEGAWSKSIIICKVHGTFLQAYADHREGHGCPDCANEENTHGLRKDIILRKPTKLYYLYLSEHNLWKIGCTSNSLAKRFVEDKHVSLEVLRVIEYPTGYEAYTIEKYLLQGTNKTKYIGSNIIVGGNTELRTQPIENLDLLLRMAEATYNILTKLTSSALFD